MSLHLDDHRGSARPRAGKTAALVPVENCGVRKGAVEFCLAAYRRVETVQATLMMAEERDFPAFLDWYQSEFRMEFQKLLMLKERARLNQFLLNRIGDKVIFERLSYAEAHRQALEERCRDPKLTAVDREKFLQELFAAPEPPAPPPRPFRPSLFFLRSQEARDARLRYCYRSLARFLHPDLHPHQHEKLRHLWAEAQVAFRTGNLDRLELIYARCQAAEGNISDDIGVEALRLTSRELYAEWQRLEESAAGKSRSLAWNFADCILSAKALANLRARVYVESRRHIKAIEEEIASLAKQLRKLMRTRRRGDNLPMLPEQLVFEFP